jgi:hypothetical protein
MFRRRHLPNTTVGTPFIFIVARTDWCVPQRKKASSEGHLRGRFIGLRRFVNTFNRCMGHVNSTFDAVYVHDQVLEDDTSKYNTGAATGDESLKNSQRVISATCLTLTGSS